MDMIAIAIKAMGIDPAQVMGQLENLGRAFDHLGRSAARQEEALARIESSQMAIMTELGLAVPPPTDEQAEMIAAESRRHADQFGGLMSDHMAIAHE